MRSEFKYALSAHRSLKDWPRGRVTPRLRRAVARVSRTAGAICSCPMECVAS